MRRLRCLLRTPEKEDVLQAAKGGLGDDVHLNLAAQDGSVACREAAEKLRVAEAESWSLTRTRPTPACCLAPHLDACEVSQASEEQPAESEDVFGGHVPSNDKEMRPASTAISSGISLATGV